MSTLYTMGIDIGSTASKCVILKDGKDIISKSLVPVGTGTSGPARAAAQVLDNCAMKKEDMGFILATGYGRNSVEMADKQMSELSCHARGARFLFPNVRTVIDIGGQDAKVIHIGAGGNLENFAMNDKCAAGTGRFLDVMSRVLEVKIDDLAKLGAQSKHHIEISSTCTVFAESEVISQLAQGAEKCDIIDGIHRAAAGRVGGLARRVGIQEDVVMTGGVARNYGVLNALEKELGTKIYTSPLAQYNGALGAALFAFDKCVTLPRL